MTPHVPSERMTIELTRTRCEGYGFCEETAPDLFRLDENGELKVLRTDVPPDLVFAAENAVRACPVAALKLKAGGPQPLQHEED